MANGPTAEPGRSAGGAAAETPVDALLPAVYDALKRLAREKMRHEPPGHTLQPTALVHEAYLRLLHDGSVLWKDPGHFYGAAAEAMRRILVERARRYSRLKHGRGLARVPLDDTDAFAPERAPEVLALDEALDRLEALDPRKARLVNLRYFAGFTIAEAADLLGVSPATAKTDWAYARAWLQKAIEENGTH